MWQTAVIALALLVGCGSRKHDTSPPTPPAPDGGTSEPAPLEAEPFYCPASASESYDDHRCAPGAEACKREEAIRTELAGGGAEPRPCKVAEAAHCYPACSGGADLRCWDSCFSSAAGCEAARAEDFRRRGECHRYESAVPGIRLGSGWWCHMASSGGERADPCYRLGSECDHSWSQHEEPEWQVGDCAESKEAVCYVTYDAALQTTSSRCFASVDICRARRKPSGGEKPVGPCQLVP